MRFIQLLKNIPKSFSQFLQPRIPVAGLRFEDAAARIVQFRGRALKKALVVLEPGIIESGKINDKVKLVAALKELREQFGFLKEKIPVIAVIPSIQIYTKVFSVPILDQKGLKEAAELNLKSLSPIDFAKASADWQQIGAQEKDGKIEILAAFAESAAVSEYISALREAGFVPVAAEFPALAIARTIKEFGVGIDLARPQIIVNVASDGIDFMLLRHGDLYFDYFVPWRLIKDEGKTARQILLDDFKATILSEVKKVANFYGSRWGEKLENLVLVTQALNMEIADMVRTNFNFKATELRLREFTDLPSSWFGALGAASRGVLPRSKDTLISLMVVGTEELSLQAEIMFFVKVWRNALLAVFGFVAFLFILADSFFALNSGRLANRLREFIHAPQGAEVVKLREQAEVFNKLVEKASAANDQSVHYSGFLIKLNQLLNNKINLSGISADFSKLSVSLIGEARDEVAAVDFKNALVKAGFENVSLPLSNIVTKPDKGVEFTMTFKLPQSK